MHTYFIFSLVTSFSSSTLLWRLNSERTIVRRAMPLGLCKSMSKDMVRRELRRCCPLMSSSRPESMAYLAGDVVNHPEAVPVELQQHTRASIISLP